MDQHRRKNIAQIPRDPVLQAGLPSGDQSAVEPPGPIPNPEVKRCSANGSETIGLVRVGRRQVYARLQVIKHLESGSFLSAIRSFEQA
jgi:hypothetical protein